MADILPLGIDLYGVVLRFRPVPSRRLHGAN